MINSENTHIVSDRTTGYIESIDVVQITEEFVTGIGAVVAGHIVEWNARFCQRIENPPIGDRQFGRRW
jgi:hypothetical protein